MSAHTPGPWSWDLHPDDESRVIALASDGRHEDVLVCTGADGRAWGEISEANARLIAAAPEMASALKNLLSGGVEGGVDDGMCHKGITTREKCCQCRRVDGARAALAKAGL